METFTRHFIQPWGELVKWAEYTKNWGLYWVYFLGMNFISRHRVHQTHKQHSFIKHISVPRTWWDHQNRQMRRRRICQQPQSEADLFLRVGPAAGMEGQAERLRRRAPRHCGGAKPLRREWRKRPGRKCGGGLKLPADKDEIVLFCRLLNGGRWETALTIVITELSKNTNTILSFLNVLIWNLASFRLLARIILSVLIC